MKTYKLFGLLLIVILGVLGVLGISTLITISFAADVTVNATSTNVAPTMSALTITPSNPNPGTTFYVAATIDDQNGQADIMAVNVSCYAPTGTEWTDSWDSIKHLNTTGYLVWTSVNTSAYTVNATFNTSVDYWSTKSANASWTCKVYANDTAGASVSNSATMTIGTAVGISLYQGTCVFTSGAPGDTDKQWGCPTATDSKNNTVQHDGNIDINVTIVGTNLTGQTDSSWVIGVGNVTWNQTTGPVPTAEAGTQLSTTAADFITIWNRGTLPTTRNTTNSTAWLDYPKPLKVQVYQGTVTFTSSAA